MSGIANASGFIGIYSTVRSRIVKSQAAIIIYHRVSLDKTGGILPLPPEIFRQHMQYFKNNFKIVPLDEIAYRTQQDTSSIKKLVAITFDDGYKDNYQYAYPILKQMKIPATIFLTTGHINSPKLFWWDEIAYIIKNTKKKKIVMEKKGPINISTKKLKKDIIKEITEMLKNKSINERSIIINKIQNSSGVTVPSRLALNNILSWDEIKEMSENGVYFGAHTVNHPNLNRISALDAEWEISQSKIDVERKIKQKIYSFSYPNGDYNKEHVSFVEKIGFSCAVGVSPTRLLKVNDNPYMLSRITGFENKNLLKTALSGFEGDIRNIMRR
jgi:peptidoglycan/xylan/chitin deacetylase (PgdA/CDA1 family)